MHTLCSLFLKQSNAKLIFQFTRKVPSRVARVDALTNGAGTGEGEGEGTRASCHRVVGKKHTLTSHMEIPK